MVDSLLAIWSRRKRLAIIVFVLPLAGVVSLVATLPNLYRSTATVLVEGQQLPQNLVQPTVTSAVETRLQTISQEVLSRSRLESLINRFNLYADLRTRVPFEDVIGRMRGDIQLELRGTDQRRGSGGRQGQGTTVAFALSYQGGNPQTVAGVTNTLASFYIEENLKARERAATGTAEFLRVQVVEMKKKLDAQEAQVGAFKRRHLGELPENAASNLTVMERLNGELRLNSDKHTRAMERREASQRQLSEAEARTGPGAASAQLAKLQAELRALRARYSDKYPEVGRVKLEIAQLEKDLAASRAEKDGRPARPVDPEVAKLRSSIAELDAELNSLKAEERRLRAAIQTYLARVENAPRREQELKELARGYETTQKIYADILQRHEQAQLAESMEQRQKGEQFRVIDPALPSGVPAAPNRLRLLLVGLALSAVLAVGLVVAAEQLHPAFHSVDDLRTALPVPVLISIPLIVTPGDAIRQRRRSRMLAAAALAGLILVAGTTAFAAHGNEYLVSLLDRGPARSRS